jgi:Zn-dependent peptidase ImmA (M78 family)
MHLGVDPRFFSLADPPPFPMGSLLYRARSRLSAASKLRAHRTAELAFETAMYLARSDGVPNNTLPRSMADDPIGAAKLARSTLGASPTGPVTSLIETLERGGAWFLPLPLEIQGHDAFSAWVMDVPVIAITGTAIPPDRLNFSLAHELGHLVMHRSPAGTRVTLESEANRFAGEFLMPESDALNELVPPLTGARLTSLKVRWHMSMQALLLRARQVGRISQDEYVAGMKWISARGWRKAEPYSRSIPRQWPQRWRQLAEVRYGARLAARRLASETLVPLRLARWMLYEDIGGRTNETDEPIIVEFASRASGRAP